MTCKVIENNHLLEICIQTICLKIPFYQNIKKEKKKRKKKDIKLSRLNFDILKEVNQKKKKGNC